MFQDYIYGIQQCVSVIVLFLECSVSKEVYPHRILWNSFVPAPLMYQNNRRLFPIIAVLTAASVIIGIYGIVFVAVDQVGGKPRSVPNLANPSPSNISQTDAQTAAAGNKFANESLKASSHLLGTHAADVLSIAALNIASNDSSDTDRSNRLLIASGSDDNTVKIWEEGTRQRDKGRSDGRSLAHNGQVDALAFIKGKDSEGSADNYRLVTGSSSGEIKLWNPLSGELVTTIAGQSGQITSLTVNAKGTDFASGSSDGTLKIWSVEDTAQQKSQTTLQGKAIAQLGSQINALAFHPKDSNILVSGDQAGTLQVWDIAQGKSILALTRKADRITSLSISPDGQYVASGSYNKRIHIWNLETGTLIRTLSGHDSVVADVAFSPDNRVLASTSYDKSIKLWDWAKSQELCTLNSPSGAADTLAFAADGVTLVSGGHNGTVRTWNLTAPSNQHCLK